MPIPTYEDLMLPFLRLLEPGETHHIRTVGERIASELRLGEQELAQLIPSGQSTVFANRLGWARTYLKKAGLIEPVARAQYRITPRGKELLKSKLSKIDGSVLRQYPEFLDFVKPRTDEKSAEEIVSSEVGTPLEILEASYERLRRQLVDELLQAIRSSSPAFFERLVVEVLVAMGYGGSLKDAGQAVGRSGDGGIDGIIKEDRLGLDQIYVQAKRWTSTVGRPEIQAFAGSLEGHRARKGVFITTSQFSSDARDYVTRIEKRIVLIDGEELAGWMIDFGVGVADVASYHVRKLDPDYFEE
ncbi:MAG: restriction endonuclease [Acidobacteriota bacterium]